MNLRIRKANAVARQVAAKPALPPLPNWVAVARWLRELNANQDGPDTIWLYCDGAGYPGAQWTVGNDRWLRDGQPTIARDHWPSSSHSEEVPGDDAPFDAAAAARRLVSEARSAGFK